MFLSRKHYYPGDAYARSKLAQVFFTKHLDNLFKDKDIKIQVHSTHPGIVNTDLFEYSSNTYIPWFKDIFYKVSWPLKVRKLLSFTKLFPADARSRIKNDCIRCDLPVFGRKGWNLPQQLLLRQSAQEGEARKRNEKAFRLHMRFVENQKLW